MLVSFSGTYLCDVQDAGFRRVKRVYWGIRVLPAGILNLDYESAVAQWETAGDQQNRTASDQHDLKMILLYTVREKYIFFRSVQKYYHCVAS